jgi:hypothetical protein
MPMPLIKDLSTEELQTRLASFDKIRKISLAILFVTVAAGAVYANMRSGANSTADVIVGVALGVGFLISLMGVPATKSVRAIRNELAVRSDVRASRA